MELEQLHYSYRKTNDLDGFSSTFARVVAMENLQQIIVYTI
jgi:hypothetical protein